MSPDGNNDCLLNDILGQVFIQDGDSIIVSNPDNGENEHHVPIFGIVDSKGVELIKLVCANFDRWDDGAYGWALEATDKGIIVLRNFGESYSMDNYSEVVYLVADVKLAIEAIRGLKEYAYRYEESEMLDTVKPLSTSELIRKCPRTTWILKIAGKLSTSSSLIRVLIDNVVFSDHTTESINALLAEQSGEFMRSLSLLLNSTGKIETGMREAQWLCEKDFWDMRTRGDVPRQRAERAITRFRGLIEEVFSSIEQARKYAGLTPCDMEDTIKVFLKELSVENYFARDSDGVKHFKDTTLPCCWQVITGLKKEGAIIRKVVIERKIIGLMILSSQERYSEEAIVNAYALAEKENPNLLIALKELLEV